MEKLYSRSMWKLHNPYPHLIMVKLHSFPKTEKKEKKILSPPWEDGKITISADRKLRHRPDRVIVSFVTCKQCYLRS